LKYDTNAAIGRPLAACIIVVVIVVIVVVDYFNSFFSLARLGRLDAA
jgi:hypothetical protein